jgi:hypothetical protein
MVKLKSKKKILKFLNKNRKKKGCFLKTSRAWEFLRPTRGHELDA